MKKILLIILVSIILFSLFSCGGDTKNNVVTPTENKPVETSGETPVSEPGKPEKIIYTDDLGEYNFGGYKYTMLTRNTTWYRGLYDVAEETGDVLDDAIYRRNRRVEERFNFTFHEIPGNEYESSRNMAKKSIQAGDNSFDLITLALSENLITFVPQGLVHPIHALPHINLDKPYWDKKLNDDILIANKLYLAIAAFNLPIYDYTKTMLFNKSMLKNLALESPYELVKANKWTFDKFEEMAKAALKDVNGDGKWDKSDIYGYLSAAHYVLPDFWLAAGVKTIEKDKDGVLYSAMGEQKFFDVFTKIFEMTRDTNIWFYNDSWDNFDEGINSRMFQNNQGLFMECTFFFMNTLRGMETDFGIIPHPKFNEAQDKYYARIEGGVSFIVPVTADNESLERTSVILEAMACESLNSVIPAYYDIALKTKNARDEESEEMIDIIFANRVLDFGDAIWYDDIRNGVMRDLYVKNNRNLASKLESMERVIKKRSDELVAAFEKLP